MSVHPSGSGPDRISMCPVRLRAFLLCSCVRRHAYRLALRRLHLEVWRQTDTKAPPPIPPTATCLTAQPGVPETAVCKAPPACMVPQPGVQGECPDLFQQRPIPCIPAPRIGITPGSMGWIPALSLQPAKMRGPVWPLSDFNRSIQEIRRSDCTASVPETAVCKAPPACMVPLGPRHDGLCWHTPPGAHVAQCPPKGPRRARPRCGEACRCLGGCSSSKCCGGTKSCSRGSTVHGERHYCWQCFGPDRASEPTAAPSPEAPDGAHPVSCRPCWHTAKGRGCQKKGCPFLPQTSCPSRRATPRRKTQTVCGQEQRQDTCAARATGNDLKRHMWRWDMTTAVYKNNTHARTGHMQAHTGTVRLLVGPDRAPVMICVDHSNSASSQLAREHGGPLSTTPHPIFSIFPSQHLR